MTSGCDERLREVKWSEELCVFMCVCVCVCAYVNCVCVCVCVHVHVHVHVCVHIQEHITYTCASKSYIEQLDIQ